ncbi:MAG: TIGR03936 family radical SAM-associated protein [Oscillospiraceae bacterium]
MSNQRIVFKKEGKAKYISHLDLMRTMQRAFIRAGVTVKHTEGFNPHPYMVFALPLSVGAESECEMMDFTLIGEDVTIENLPMHINRALPEGIMITEAYNTERRFKEIVWLKVEGTLWYDTGLPEGAAEKLSSFFASEKIVMSKKTKSGISDSDIKPCINAIDFKAADGKRISVETVLTAQNPSLNPEHLVGALRQLRPDIAPDFAEFRRKAVYDKDMKIFR